VDDAAENTATDYLAVDGGRGRGAGEWLVEMETAMRPGFVVMAEVLGEQRLEMSSRHDEEAIEALLADGPHEPLGESVVAGARMYRRVQVDFLLQLDHTCNADPELQSLRPPESRPLPRGTISAIGELLRHSG